jgi:hypothetical protein
MKKYTENNQNKWTELEFESGTGISGSFGEYTQTYTKA